MVCHDLPTYCLFYSILRAPFRNTKQKTTKGALQKPLRNCKIDSQWSYFRVTVASHFLLTFCSPLHLIITSVYAV